MPHGKTGIRARRMACCPNTVNRSSISLKAELKDTLKLAGPIVLNQVGHMSMGMVDTLVAGHISTTALAGLGLAANFFWTFTAVCLGSLLALDTYFSQAVGARDEAALRRYLGQSLWSCGLVAVPAAALDETFAEFSPELVILSLGFDVLAGALRSLSNNTAPETRASVYFTARSGARCLRNPGIKMFDLSLSRTQRLREDRVLADYRQSNAEHLTPEECTLLEFSRTRLRHVATCTHGIHANSRHGPYRTYPENARSWPIRWRELAQLVQA